MGCESSQLANGAPSSQVKVSVIDSTFMKPENESIRKEMGHNNIDYDYFVSLDCFFEQFLNRYYNKVVTCVENYKQLKNNLQKMSFSPNIYVVLRGAKIDESLPFNVRLVENYTELIQVLQQKRESKHLKNSQQNKNNWKACSVKILSKPGPKTSEETIFQAALAKANISFEFYNSFQLLEQSVGQSIPQFIVTNYIYHREVVQLAKNTKMRVICYCTFDKSESYAPEVYSTSNNYLDITQDIKQELKFITCNTVKCSKAYFYTNGISDYEEIQYQIQKFSLEIRPFNNLDKVIKETTYFFCVTVLAAETEIKNLTRYFEKNDYIHRVKLVSLPKNCEPNLNCLFKTIRTLKKGYRIEKSITNSLDIIDKHYDNVKFEQIKKELEANSISCHGFTNLSSYIKTKKFISPFIICNYEERMLLLKYMKQLQCKAKIIIFCNKNKIKEDLKDNKAFAFVSSHFGKIIKFVQKTLVFVPKLAREEDSKFHEKIEKIKSKNRRISALKWGLIEKDSKEDSDDTFEFLNIANHTNNASIRDIQKTVSMLWKLDTSILTKLPAFKKDLAESLEQLRKIYQITYPEDKFKELLDKLKKTSISDLMNRVKQFFESENELGLEINKSLIHTENLPKKQIENLREFLLLVFLNYCSAYSAPRVGKLKLKHWMSNSLVEKCEVGSYLFCKNFLIAYEDKTEMMQKLSKVKIEIEIEYNTLTEAEIYLNSFITHKDKFIFCPFSQFQVAQIINANDYKIIQLKYIKNVDFLKYIYSDNLQEEGKSLQNLFATLSQPNHTLQIVDETNAQIVRNNLKRYEAIEKFRKGEVQEAIQIHLKLISISEEQENLNSALVNQLNYQLACFYLKAEKMEDAAALMKELISSNPGDYIKAQCELMINETLQEDEPNDGKTSRINEVAMKTFIWLKNTSSERDESEGQDLMDEDADEIDEGAVIFDHEVPCMEINELGEELDDKENMIS